MSEIDQKLGKHIKSVTIIARVKTSEITAGNNNVKRA